MWTPQSGEWARCCHQNSHHELYTQERALAGVVSANPMQTGQCLPPSYMSKKYITITTMGTKHN
jgi:hypothetical protein